MKSSVAIQCGSARIKLKSDVTPHTNQDPSTPSATCNSQECPFKTHPKESGDDNPPQVKKRSFWQFVGPNLDPLPFAITRDNKKKEVEAWSRIYPINIHNIQPLITFLGMFRHLDTVDLKKSKVGVSNPGEKDDKVVSSKTELDIKARNVSPRIKNGIETVNEKKPNDVTPLDKSAEIEVIISNTNSLEEYTDVIIAHEAIREPQLQRFKPTDKHTLKHVLKLKPVKPLKAEHEKFKHVSTDNNEKALPVGHKISTLPAKHRKDTVSQEEGFMSLGMISGNVSESNDTVSTYTTVSNRSKSLAQHSVQQIDISSKKTNSHLPVPKNVSNKCGGFDYKSNTMKGADKTYRMGSPGPAISRTGLFCVVPKVARLRPSESSFRSRTVESVVKEN